MLPQRAPSVVPSSVDYSDGSYLAALLKQVVTDLGKYKDRGAITDDTPEVHGLCFVLEKIFLHELKTGTRNSFWEFVERLQDSLPGKQATGLLGKLRAWTRSGVGRGRAFLRLSLNQHTIVEYLQALVWNVNLLRSYYTRGAFFRNEHLVTEMMEQLELVLPLQFSLTMHFNEIDREDYWNMHRTEIHDLHIRVITGRESEFKFGLLSVEGDERRRREMVRKRANSLNRGENEGETNGGAENDATERADESSEVPMPAPSPTEKNESEEKNEEKSEALEAPVVEVPAAEATVAVMEEKNEAPNSQDQQSEESEEERKRRESEEAERKRLEEEERTVLEEARRLEEELAWRRKQRELARRRARGADQQRKRELNNEQGISEIAETSPAAKTTNETQKHENERRPNGGGEALEVPQDKSAVPKVEKNESERENDSGSQNAQPAAVGTEAAHAASTADVETDNSEATSTLQQVEHMLRELEERRRRLLSDVPYSPPAHSLVVSPTLPAVVQPTASVEVSAVEQPTSSDQQSIDELLRELSLSELDSLDEVLSFCEQLHQDESRAAAATTATTTTSTTADVLSQSYHERSRHLDEVLRFCDELDAELVGVEFEHAHDQRVRRQQQQQHHHLDRPSIRVLSSSPAPFVASFKHEGVWPINNNNNSNGGSPSGGGDPHRRLRPLMSPKVESIKSKLSASPKREMLLFHLQQKRSERERLGGGPPSTAAAAAAAPAPLTITKESPTHHFKASRGRTNSLLTQDLEAPKEPLETGHEGRAGLVRSTPAARTAKNNSNNGETEDEDDVVEVVRPLVGSARQRDFRSSYYASLRLHSPSKPSPTDIAAVQARNTELRRVRSIEREQRRLRAEVDGLEAAASEGESLSPRRTRHRQRTASASAPQLTETSSFSPSTSRRKLDFGDGSGSSSSVGADVVEPPQQPKLQRPVWARDAEHTKCGLCDAGFSLVVRRHHCRVCGQIFCYRCCVKTPVPDLDYKSPVHVCKLCFSTFPSTEAK